MPTRDLPRQSGTIEFIEVHAKGSLARYDFHDVPLKMEIVEIQAVPAQIELFLSMEISFISLSPIFEFCFK